MAEGCNICALIKNSNGDIVDSKLFSDLLHYTSDRTLTKLLYAVSMDSKFQSLVADKAEFDENGEITLKSLLNLTRTNLGNEELLQKLNKDIGNGSYSYLDAIQRLLNFNRNNPFNDRYLATITPSNGQYKLSVVKKSSAEERKLNDTIANLSLQDRIIATLAKHGVAVDFLKDATEHSRYSTENAKQTADGLYHLIRIANGESVAEDLCEEAGHFAIGALGNSPLAERLLNLLTPEVQRQALGDSDYENKYLGKDSRREVAGDLVGKALANNIDKQTTWGRLASRISDLARRVFYTIKGDQVRIARLKAEQMAELIAKGFMSSDFLGDLETALGTKETLYSADYSENVKAYKKVLNQLKTAAAEFKAMNSTLGKVFDNIIALVQSDGRENAVNTQIGILSDTKALEGITEAMDLLVDLMGNEIPMLLDSVDFNNTLDFAFNMARNGHSLHEAHIATRRCFEVMLVINSSIGSASGHAKLTSPNGLKAILMLDSSTGTMITKDLVGLAEALAKFTSNVPNSFYAQLRDKEAQFYCKFLEDSYGNTFVERGARALFKWGNWNKRGKHLIEFKNGGKVNIADIITDLEGDISVFDRFLGSMSNSSDIASLIVDKVTKQANKQADDMTNEIWDLLKALLSQLKLIGTNPAKFYETDGKGHLTGNVISDKRWGVWELEHEAMMKLEKENFLKQHEVSPGVYDFDDKTDFEKALLWNSYFKPINKQWHKTHSVFDLNEGRYVPSDIYHNSDYDLLTTEERQWLNEMLAIKDQLDSMTGGAMPSHRMPLFKGTFMNRVRNRGSRLNPKLYGLGMWEATKETFCLDSEDTDYGGYMNYNKEEEDMFTNQFNFEKEKLNRLPLFGINKLDDMTLLSTDIFQSMLAYAGMATHYAAMNLIVDTLEVGKYVLNRRTVGGVSTEEFKEANKSRAFNRYIKYLDKQVYGVSQRPIVLTHGIVLNKIASFLSGLSSKIFLGGNVAGGLVNLGTGINEIAKEAAAGEFFTMKDWMNANVDYWKSIPANLWDTGKLDKENKVALFMKHFNTLGDSKLKQRDWHTLKSRAANFLFGECLMLPYTSGDHYMQTMSYLSLANHIKVIDEHGHRTSLWNAYQVLNIEYTDLSGITTSGKKYGKTLKLGGIYFKTLQDKQEYEMLQSIVNEVETAKLNAGIFGPQVNLSQDLIDYINNKGWNVADVVNNIALYQNEMHKHTWNEDDESALMDKAREINDRLHGIYNDLDKTAAHLEIWSNMLLAMRGYALGMIQRRFGSAKYSVALGGEVEGTMRTVAKVIASCATDEWGVGKAALAIFLPFLGSTKLKMLDAGFSANQYANMRRNFGDFFLIGALMLLKMLTAKPDDDDDEREEYYAMLRKQGVKSEVIKQMKQADKEMAEDNIEVLGIANYFASRLLREQMAYNTAIGAEDEWSSITSLTPSGIAVVEDLWTLGTYFYGDMMYDYQEPDEEYYESLKKAGISEEVINQIKKQDLEDAKNAPGREYFYLSSKSGMYQKGDPKWKRKLKTMTPYYRSTNVLFNPYEAAASFDYGRKVKNR